VLILAGLITWIVQSGRRRSAATTGWQSRIIDAYAKGAALHDAMGVAEAQGDLGTSDARARWYDIQRRSDDLAQTLYALREAATDPGDQARIADVLAALQAVRTAMDAERAPGGAGMQQADLVRSRLRPVQRLVQAGPLHRAATADPLCPLGLGPLALLREEQLRVLTQARRPVPPQRIVRPACDPRGVGAPVPADGA